MTVGKHHVSGRADNHKVAKHLAASQILKLLHSNYPEIKSWGDLLRMYSPKKHAEFQNATEEQEKEILRLVCMLVSC